MKVLEWTAGLTVVFIGINNHAIRVIVDDLALGLGLRLPLNLN